VPAPGDGIRPQAAAALAGCNGSGGGSGGAPPTEPPSEGQTAASEPSSDGGAEPVVAAAALADAPAPSVAPPAEPAAQPAVWVQPVARAEGRPGGGPETPEGHWEEVWRPRRKGRTFETASERHSQQRARHSDKAPGQEARLKPGSQGGKPRGRRPDRRHGGERQERSRPPMHASAPPSKAAFDPDSPFAALSSLKAQMEKRSQD
jgi:ATP-dependent RNA helicase SUPV3L1/SUV3